MTDWTANELDTISRSAELEIATRRADGTLRRWLPIWAVCADGQVFVRTWQRRDTGWFGHVLSEQRARVRVPGLEVDVTVEDVGRDGRRHAVDAAYRAKYGRTGAPVDRMVGDDAAAATLLLVPERAGQ